VMESCPGLPPGYMKKKWSKQNLSEQEILQCRFNYSVGVCRVPTNLLETGQMTNDELVTLEAKQEVS